ncbi:MAG: general secretion pathway protein GspB [bacterium]
MSVILDALKRLDREKSSRRGGTANIAAEILRPELSRPRKKIALYAIPVFLTAIAAAAVTYVLMSEPGSLPKSSPPVPVSHPAPIQQATPAPLSREPVRDARDEISRVPQKMESPAGSKPTETPSGEKKVERNVTSEETDTTHGSAKKVLEHTQTGPSAVPPSLAISAIVWYEDPSKRFAMINGMISTEGSMVEGVKVEEINPTSVRFSHNGQYFEIPISK